MENNLLILAVNIYVTQKSVFIKDIVVSVLKSIDSSLKFIINEFHGHSQGNMKIKKRKYFAHLLT